MWTGNPWPQDLLLGSRVCHRRGNSPGPGKTSIHRQGAGLSGEGRGAWLWLVGRTCSPCTQALCPPGSGAACGWGPRSPVHAGISATGLHPSPHAAGAPPQQQTVVPVDGGQPALLQLCRPTGAVPGPPCAQVYLEDPFDPTVPGP